MWYQKKEGMRFPHVMFSSLYLDVDKHWSKPAWGGGGSSHGWLDCNGRAQADRMWWLLHSPVAPWLFHCCTCAQVCPWTCDNTHTHTHRNPVFFLSSDLSWPLCFPFPSHRILIALRKCRTWRWSVPLQSKKHRFFVVALSCDALECRGMFLKGFCVDGTALVE